MTNITISVSDDIDKNVSDFISDNNCRYLSFIIKNEELVLNKSVPKIKNDEDDFNTIKENIPDNIPVFVLFKFMDDVRQKYLFIVYIPSKSDVKSKIIYASSRMHIKRRFTKLLEGLTDYFIDDIKDISYNEYSNYNNKENDTLTENEIALRENNKGVGVVHLPEYSGPFWKLSEELESKLYAMNSDCEYNFVAGMSSSDSDSISLSGYGNSLSQIDNSSPRYIAMKREGNFYFILYCPDTAKAREKMISSTCKSSFIKCCKELNIEFVKSFDIRNESDFNDQYLAELFVDNTDKNCESIKVFSKPKRPGRR